MKADENQSYFLYKNIDHFVQLQLEKKLLDTFDIYKHYLDTVDSFVQPTVSLANINVTQLLPLQHRRRICSNAKVESINYINPIVTANPT